MSNESKSPGASTSEYNKNININDAETKNMILKYLYGKNLKNTISFTGIQKVSDLDNIKNGDYIVCPRFRGSRSWVIFFKTQGSKHEIPNYYAVSFPKHSQYKKINLRIHAVDISVSREFYNGTIMEGIFYRVANEKFLIIDEVYTLCGENQLLKSKTDRLNYLSNFITTNTVQTLSYHLYPCQYYSLTESNLSELYDKIKGDNRIQDIIFYPQIHGRKIYQYTIIDIDLTDDIIKTGVFKLQKTNNPDVYNVISFKTDNKIDIAYLPDMATSKKCKQWFKDEKATELAVKCRMNMEHKKWIPIELIETDVDIRSNKTPKKKSGKKTDRKTDRKTDKKTDKKKKTKNNSKTESRESESESEAESESESKNEII